MKGGGEGKKGSTFSNEGHAKKKADHPTRKDLDKK